MCPHLEHRNAVIPLFIIKTAKSPPISRPTLAQRSALFDDATGLVHREKACVVKHLFPLLVVVGVGDAVSKLENQELEAVVVLVVSSGGVLKAATHSTHAHSSSGDKKGSHFHTWRCIFGEKWAEMKDMCVDRRRQFNLGEEEDFVSTDALLLFRLLFRHHTHKSALAGSRNCSGT